MFQPLHCAAGSFVIPTFKMFVYDKISSYTHLPLYLKWTWRLLKTKDTIQNCLHHIINIWLKTFPTPTLYYTVHCSTLEYVTMKGTLEIYVFVSKDYWILPLVSFVYLCLPFITFPYLSIPYLSIPFLIFPSDHF